MFATIKSAALASIVVLATSTGAFAAAGQITKDTHVKKHHWPSQTIDIAVAGEPVWIHDCKAKTCYVERDWGHDGWVKKADLKFAPKPDPKPPGFFDGFQGGTGVSFCVGGEKGSFCIQGNK